ncbi:MAG TPA: glycosyltransferase, partial [Flavobacterium sp.]|nr:glycosyltransferase [Flavobacterium sp.]
MNIYFDNLVYSLQRAGGISTYWGEISSRLLRDGHDIFFDEYIGAENVVRNQLEIPLDKLRIRNNKFLIAKRFMDFRLKEFKKPFIFHSSYNRISNNLNALNVCTIHDFVHEKFYSGLRKKLHAQQKKKAISHAKRIITVSDNTKNDLLNFFPEIDPGTIKTIYNGVSDDFYPLDPKCVITEEARPYLLFIGSREHYKNYEFCVELMAELSAFDFWIVGPALNATETSMLNAKLKNRWKISTYIDNQTLNKIYNGAFAL